MSASVARTAPARPDRAGGRPWAGEALARLGGVVRSTLTNGKTSGEAGVTQDNFLRCLLSGRASHPYAVLT